MMIFKNGEKCRVLICLYTKLFFKKDANTIYFNIKWENMPEIYKDQTPQMIKGENEERSKYWISLALNHHFLVFHTIPNHFIS